MPDPTGKDEFLYPTGRFYGDFSPEKLLFDANLQEFSHRVTIICALENGGKIPPIEAYKQIKLLWKQLKVSKNNLLTDDEDEL
ncbi:hypothetical protein Syn7502_00921 [Synechococcus sp. PCC 7502]|uniref:DUF7219 family protein n=1 Tax=Synechococcus sp. PCC 7502 TaxID=1173263 RepID=UPI00029FA0FE|nr:hypothetical protein [Synechococcus sp. PCC 7502]AFY73039.1 hypothetical protein Syn7502_00921 [Synechococcus sp. PCC 7502]